MSLRVSFLCVLCVPTFLASSGCLQELSFLFFFALVVDTYVPYQLHSTLAGLENGLDHPFIRSTLPTIFTSTGSEMHFNYGTLASMALAFVTLGNSHLIMKTPVPFGVSTLNNSPLVDAKPGSSTSDYPCKQRPGVYDITKMNNMPVGAPQELSFEGSASHGGGTCQIAVTKDKEPTADSTFKIIQVFEGGCPIDSNGNGETHPFTFTIPENFPNGVMTLAWLWYNRIGKFCSV